MRKAFTALLAFMLVVTGPMTFRHPVRAELAPQSAIAAYLAHYGYKLTDFMQNRPNSTQVIDCEEVKVILTDILYDGRMMYTAASVVPAEPEKVLIMPGSAMPGDTVNGRYGEEKRDDNREFHQAALEDNKRLLAVYIYPKEFDGQPFCFVDHFQLDGDESILLSGAKLPTDKETLSFTWTIQLYDVEPKTGNYSLIKEYEAFASVALLQPLIRKTYRVKDGESLPFDTVTLVQSALGVYVEPNWKNAQDQEAFGIRLTDAKGEEAPKNTPYESRAYSLDHLPESLYIKANNYSEGKPGIPILITSIE